MASPSSRLPLASVRSPDGNLLGSVSSLPDGSPDPLLASVLRSYVERLAAEARASQLARERASRGEITMEEAVELAVGKLMPLLRRLAMKHGEPLGEAVRELTFPFRISAAFQTQFVEALDRAVLAVMTAKSP